MSYESDHFRRYININYWKQHCIEIIKTGYDLPKMLAYCYQRYFNDFDKELRTLMDKYNKRDNDEYYDVLKLIDFVEKYPEHKDLVKPCLMEYKNNVALVFSRTPRIWGLRGDPYFWQYLEEKFQDKSIPMEPDLFEEIIKKEYFKLCKKDIGENAYIEGFAHGGMSSGVVSGAWIHLIPLLKYRLILLNNEYYQKNGERSKIIDNPADELTTDNVDLNGILEEYDSEHYDSYKAEHAPNSVKQLQIEYWSELSITLKNNYKKFKPRKPDGNAYYLSLKSKHAHISMKVNSVKKLQECKIVISDNKELFDNLEKSKNIIEGLIGFEILWERKQGKESHITINRGFDIRNDDEWDDAISWHLNMASLFYDIFSKRISTIIKSLDNNSEIIIKQSDIADLDVDAVVNAANPGLQMGGGVCGSIYRKAGAEELARACAEIGGCERGSAVITPGFNLKARYIIHAVGPKWRGGNNGEEKLLYKAYIDSLNLARKHDCHSIAFPLISSGIYGYPKDNAWKIAIKACSNFIKSNPDYNIQITFAVLSDSSKDRGEYFLNIITGFHMKCPHCTEDVKVGDIICSNCKYEIMDFNYFENLEKIEK
ncbi:MAG: DUF4268 domain-containing protein, partial [Methanobrevibacter sp.]|nr:DUF4268 domain-containing protein [Methanobrevibacter sp.]